MKKSKQINSLKVLFAIMISLCMSNCVKKETVEVGTSSKAKSQILASTSDFSGNYVTEEYHKKSEGYDWLVLKVIAISNDSLKVSILSRNDKKKPTCSFEGGAKFVSKNVYEATSGDHSFLINFKDDKVTLSSKTKNDTDKNSLNWFCSGGASLSDYTFTELTEDLDETQLNGNN